MFLQKMFGLADVFMSGSHIMEDLFPASFSVTTIKSRTQSE